jgi:hypothetical protein
LIEADRFGELFDMGIGGLLKPASPSFGAQRADPSKSWRMRQKRGPVFTLEPFRTVVNRLSENHPAAPICMVAALSG